MINGKKSPNPLRILIFYLPLHRKQAQMAELVDALVSNTSGFTSMPVRSRLWVQNRKAKY